MSSAIITSARKLVGTRFMHQGRLAKTGNHQGGVDCLGLLICVARECELRSKTGVLLADVDEFNYPHYPDEARLRQMLSLHLDEVTDDRCKEADIALFEIDGRAQHLGIIAYSDTLLLPPVSLTIIHAYAPARRVVEHALDEYWRKKIVAVFRLTPAT